MASYTPFAHSMLFCHRSVLRTATRLLSPVRSSDFSLHLPGRAIQTVNPTKRCFSSSLQTSSASPWLMVPPYLVADGPYKKSTSTRNTSHCSYCKSIVMDPIVRLTKLEVKRENWKVDPEERDYYFLNAAEDKVLKKKINLRMPWQTDHLSPYQAICIGSSHGWLAYIHRRNCSLYLYNPFIDSSYMPYLPLPPIETLPPVISSQHLSGVNVSTEFMISKQMSPVLADNLSQNFFRKVIMSSAPSPFGAHQDSHCTVMAIYGKDHPQQLAFCRIGDTSWTALDSPLEDDDSYEDLLYFSKNKKFYALSKRGYVESWDLTNPSSPKRSLVISTLPPLMQPTMDNHQQNVRGYPYARPKKYLVESLGELLMVLRYPHFGNNSSDKNCTAAFDVYKRNFVENKWVYVPSLGDRVLFIGQNHSVSLSANDFSGLRKSSIYFTPEYIQKDSGRWPSGCNDLGVFNLEDDSLDIFHLKNIEPSPIWVVPQI